MADNQEDVVLSTSDRKDQLLECLMMLIHYYNRHFAEEALVAGLPLVNNQLTPSLFLRAAERAGFLAKVIERPLKKISNLLLPAVLILKNNQCCVLKKWIDEGETAEVMLPELGIEVQRSYEQLSQLYGGFAILVQPVSVAKTQAEESPAPKQHSWFWGTLWTYRRAYYEVLLAALFINIFALASPLFVMNVYDRVIPNNAMVTLWTLSIGILVIYTFDLILRFLRAYLIDVVGKRADIIMASTLFQQILSMELRHKPRSVGSFITNLREFETVRDFFTSATLTTLVDLPFLLLYAGLIGYIGGWLILVPVIMIPLILMVAWAIQKPLYKSVQESLKSSSQKGSIVVENLVGLEVVKSLAAEGLVQRKWERAVGENARVGLKSRFLSGSITHITYYLQQLVTIFIVIMGVYEIEKGNLTLGGLIACSILAGRMMAPLAQVMSLLTRYQQAKYALQGLNHIMSLPTEYSSSSKFLRRETVDGEIEFSQVSFHYPDQEGSKALNNLSFKIKAGEHVALLGNIGSGKSTLAKLILGLYRPTSGSIYIDGVDIEQLDPTNLRRFIGYVPQDSFLFAGTIRSNIVMGQPWASDQAVLAAAKLSGADQFISRHPSGYGLAVGERGEGLSGGQRQTIAIARALISNPPILLFDEPTSSMDERLEREWVANMKTYMVGRTVLLVTHKAPLLALVDRIMILENGKLIIDGPKDDVIRQLTQAQQKAQAQRKL